MEADMPRQVRQALFHPAQGPVLAGKMIDQHDRAALVYDDHGVRRRLQQTLTLLLRNFNIKLSSMVLFKKINKLNNVKWTDFLAPIARTGRFGGLVQGPVCVGISVSHTECGAVLRAALAPVVETCGRHVGIDQAIPGLCLGRHRGPARWWRP